MQHLREIKKMSVPETLLSNTFVKFITHVQNLKATIHDNHFKQKLDMLSHECFNSCPVFIAE